MKGSKKMKHSNKTKKANSKINNSNKKDGTTKMNNEPILEHRKDENTMKNVNTYEGIYITGYKRKNNEKEYRIMLVVYDEQYREKATDAFRKLYQDVLPYWTTDENYIDMDVDTFEGKPYDEACGCIARSSKERVLEYEVYLIAYDKRRKRKNFDKLMHFAYHLSKEIGV